MDKYRKVEKPRETTVKDDAEIRVTAAGSVSAYVSRAAKVYGELERPEVVIKATGNALTKAVTLAEVIKRRFKGLHQITALGSTEIADEYEPLEEGLDKVIDTRNISIIEIRLSKEPLDTSDGGYQAPIDEGLVTELDPEQMSKPRGRGRGGGKGRGRGKGKGKGKAEDPEEEEEAPPKGEGNSKGKGKGEGKIGAPESKGKGKGEGKAKGKGKGKADGPPVGSPKGAGKGGRQRERRQLQGGLGRRLVRGIRQLRRRRQQGEGQGQRQGQRQLVLRQTPA